MVATATERQSEFCEAELYLAFQMWGVYGTDPAHLRPARFAIALKSWAREDAQRPFVRLRIADEFVTCTPPMPSNPQPNAESILIDLPVEPYSGWTANGDLVVDPRAHSGQFWRHLQTLAEKIMTELGIDSLMISVHGDTRRLRFQKEKSG